VTPTIHRVEFLLIIHLCLSTDVSARKQNFKRVKRKTLLLTKTNPDTPPLFVHRSLWETCGGRRSIAICKEGISLTQNFTDVK
jgi:hypothetical protein